MLESDNVQLGTFDTITLEKKALIIMSGAEEKAEPFKVEYPTEMKCYSYALITVKFIHFIFSRNSLTSKSYNLTACFDNLLIFGY